jgi:hypothetical protein
LGHGGEIELVFVAQKFLTSYTSGGTTFGRELN